MKQDSICFLAPDPSDRATGGMRYNQALIDGLKNKGFQIVLAQNINACFRNSICIVDSLFIPQMLAHKIGEQPPTILLYHQPPELNSELSIAVTSDLKQLIAKCHLVCVSKMVHSYLRETFSISAHTANVIEPGVDAYWQTKSHYAKQPKKLLYIASLIRHKGYERLFEILEYIRACDWTLDVYGETTQQPNYYQKLVKKLQHSPIAKRITIHGQVSAVNINQAMLRADLLLQCSEYESYSMITAEAIAARLPVLSTKVGNYDNFRHSSYVQHFQHSDPYAQAQELKSLLENPDAYFQLTTDIEQNGVTRRWQQVVQDWQALLNKMTYK